MSNISDQPCRHRSEAFMTLGRSLYVLPYAVLLAGILLPAAPPVRAGNKDYPIRPVDFTKVHVMDAFWAPRLETNRTVAIPLVFKRAVEAGRMENFARAGGVGNGALHREVSVR
jgi:hypothetical protein